MSRQLTLRLAASAISAIVLGVTSAAPSTHPVRAAATTVATSGWLTRLNSWRSNVGLPAVTENTTWSTGDYDHAVYMVKNDLVTHYETPGTAYYTTDGDTAARNSNIYVSSSTATTDEAAIDWWMQAPFHALGLMDPRLTTSGFGSYREVKPGWDMGAAVDVLRGNSFTGGTYPVYFPGNGTSEPLASYDGNEFPNPLQACSGYAAPTGLPVFVQVGGNVATTAGPVHSFTANGVALDHCVIDSNSPSVGSGLTSRGGVIVIPRQPLVAGVNYSVSLTVNGVAYQWSFTVGALSGVPGAPTAVTASTSGNTATVTWSPPSVDGGSPVVSYTVTPYAGSVAGVPQTVLAPTTTAAFTGLTTGTAYHFTVAATTAHGTGAPATSNNVIPGWLGLGGSLTSGAGPSSCAAGDINVYVLGGDGVPWYKHWNGTSWGSWTMVGGNVAGNPASVCEPGTTTTHLFTEGQDTHLWHRVWNGSGFGPWENMSGSLTSGPGTMSCGANNADVFVLGGDGVVWYKTWNGSIWSGWIRVGGNVTGNPAVVCQPGTHVVDLFVEGTDGRLYHKNWNGSAWLPWENLGGSLSSSPAVVSCTAGTLDVFVNGGDGVLWHKTWNGSTWSGWIRVGGNWTSDPGAVCLSGSTKIEVFSRGPDGALWAAVV